MFTDLYSRTSDADVAYNEGPRGSVTDELKELRRAAADELSAALEGVHVKGVIDLVNRQEVSRAAEAVSVAVLCMIAWIDDTGAIELEADGLPSRTWAAAQSLMAKPAPFINQLRRFPYAVDGGRMPEANAAVSVQIAQAVDFQELEGDAPTTSLFQWLQAAQHYIQVQQPGTATLPRRSMERLAGAGLIPQEDVPQVEQNPGYMEEVDERDPNVLAWMDEVQDAVNQGAGVPDGWGVTYAGRVQPSPEARDEFLAQIQEQQMNGGYEEAPLENSPPPAAPRQSRAQPRASANSRPSAASSAGTRQSVPTRPATSGPSASMRRSQERAARASEGGGRGVARGTGSSPSLTPSQSQLSSPASQPFRRLRPQAGSPPMSAARPRADMKEMQRELERLRRETREAKAEDASIKWAMKREEDKEKRKEKKKDVAEIMDWRQAENKKMLELAAEKKKVQKVLEMQESREFEEFKREKKGEEKAIKVQEFEEAYLETKDVSEWNAERNRAFPPEDRAFIIDQNLEKYRLFAEYALMEQTMEKQDRMDNEALREQQEMDYLINQAKREKEEALQGLEFFRAQREMDIPQQQHLPSEA